ncbi:hypothetical protein J3F83DRAFT_36732 [Trichoderma novae-zelandiae]
MRELRKGVPRAGRYQSYQVLSEIGTQRLRRPSPYSLSDAAHPVHTTVNVVPHAGSTASTHKRAAEIITLWRLRTGRRAAEWYWLMPALHVSWRRIQACEAYLASAVGAGRSTGRFRGIALLRNASPLGGLRAYSIPATVSALQTFPLDFCRCQNKTDNTNQHARTWVKNATVGTPRLDWLSPHYRTSRSAIHCGD